MKEQINQKLDKFYEHSFLAVPVTIAVTFVGWDQLPRLGGSNEMLRYIIALIYGLVVYCGFMWFRKGHVYSCGLKKHGLKNLWMILPVLMIDFFRFLKPISAYGAELLNGKLLIFALILAVQAGVSEELLMRALPLGNVLCRAKTRKQFLGLVFLTSFFFGLMHIENYFRGDALAMILSQIFDSGCIGVFYAAIYLRTGSIIPCIVLHALWDLPYFLNPALVAGESAALPAMEFPTDSFASFPPEYLVLALVLAGIFAAALSAIWVVYGMFLMRKSKWEEIKANFTR